MEGRIQPNKVGRLRGGALIILMLLVVGLMSFIAGSILGAADSTRNTAKIVVTVTSIQTVVRSTVVTTTLTTATPTTVTETKVYTKTIFRTVPPEIFEVPVAEWLTEDERIKVRADLVIENGRFNYIRVKVTNVGNETLRYVIVIFVPYIGGRPSPSSQNIVILRDIGVGETQACRFRIPTPDTHFKVLALAL